MQDGTRGWSEQQWEDYFAGQDESFFMALRSRTSREQPGDDVRPSPESAGTMDDLLAAASADTLLEEEDALIRELYAGLGQRYLPGVQWWSSAIARWNSLPRFVKT